jgi:hypothetical protein
VNHFEGWAKRRFAPTIHSAYHCGRKAAMAAEILKRKLRNFPVANLAERIATA